MFKNYLKGIEGIADYPVISLIAFFLFFVVVLIWWIRLDKKQIQELSQLPLDETGKVTGKSQFQNQEL